jgi:hypothetical protein
MDSQRRRDARADLKATSEDLAHDARRVASIEELKARLDPMDPRMLPLAEESEAIAAEMATKAEMESHLAREAAAETPN